MSADGRNAVWLAVALAASIATTPANATLIDVTWLGTVVDGNDPADVFGVPIVERSHDLAGFAFKATYRFDTASGSLVQGAGFADLRGGTLFGSGLLPSPAVSATLTINGVTVSFGSDLFGGYSRKSADGVSDIYAEVNASNIGGGADILFLSEFRFDEAIPFGGLTESVTLALTNVGDLVRGVFQQLDDSTSAQLFAGNLRPTSVTIAPVVVPIDDTPPGGSPIPEPASLALLGAGLLGLVRARRASGRA